jgi:hypothetical protein
MLKAALQITQPSQWMVYGDGDKRSIYATAGAADRILRQGFAMSWGEKTVEVTRDDKAVVVTCSADLRRPDGSVYERFIGTRRGEIRSDGDIKGYLKDEQALIKGAIANLKHRAVTALLGLTFLTPDDLREHGFDLDKVKRRVSYQDHTKQTRAEPGAMVVPFGKNKGKTPAELSDRQLDWYIEQAEQSVSDPEKSKWRDNNQAWLDALRAEQDQRKRDTTDAAGEMPQWEDSQ